MFYLVFYSCLAAFWASLLYLRVTLLPDVEDGPFQKEYMNHRGPGLSVRPTGDQMSRNIKFNKNDPKSYEEYIESVNIFLENYMTIDGKDYEETFKQCNEDQKDSCTGGSTFLEAVTVEIERNKSAMDDSQSNNKSADVYRLYNLNNLGECSESEYGFSDGEPCFYFTINQVWDWAPVPLSDESKESNDDVKNMNTSGDFISFGCKGLKDNYEKMIESIKIFPEQGFQSNYFPWEGQKNYRTPIVAAKIKLKPESMDKRVRIECKIYADNVHGDAMSKPNIGRSEIELTISDDKNETANPNATETNEVERNEDERNEVEKNEA